MTYMEELIYALGHQLEALRLEIRAASRRRDQDVEAAFYEGMADGKAAIARPQQKGKIT